jgi:short-subunit dehydrogenase
VRKYPVAGSLAVVTGAAGGIGQELCRSLLVSGARVVATDLAGSTPFPEDFEVDYRSLDVSDPAACRALAKEADPDIWINNAGILGAGDVSSQTGEEAAKVIAVNLTGVVNGTLAAIGTMTAKKSGRILNMGSFAAWTPAPGLAVYSATKHAVRAFSIATAAELAGSGIRISVLCPDGVWTPMLHDQVFDGPSTMSFTAKRLLQPHEVAEAAMRLLESGSLVGSLPRSRAIMARLLGSSARATVALAPAMARLGRAGQRRMQRSVQSNATGGGC